MATTRHEFHECDSGNCKFSTNAKLVKHSFKHPTKMQLAHTHPCLITSQVTHSASANIHSSAAAADDVDDGCCC
eukprot:8700153-Lingulodinium_polyedra.AAC.1